MLGGQPRVAAVVAVSDCTLIAIEHQAFAAVCEQVPDVAVKVLIYLAQRLHRLRLQVRVGHQQRCGPRRQYSFAVIWRRKRRDQDGFPSESGGTSGGCRCRHG